MFVVLSGRSRDNSRSPLTVPVRWVACKGGLCFNPFRCVARLAGAPSFHVNRPLEIMASAEIVALQDDNILDPRALLFKRQELWGREWRRQLLYNLVPRAFSSTIFKMADRREKTDTEGTQQKSRDRFVHGGWKFIQNGGQDKEWEDLGTRSWDWWKTNKMAAKQLLYMSRMRV